ncbi:MAG: long-chain-fatty-acid--CoA ligase [Deltaproteobacteria bacterium]
MLPESIASLRNIPRILEEGAAVHPRRPALVFGSLRIDYKTAWEKSCRITRHLVESIGIKPGERVALLADNAPEFVYAYFGILRAGGIVVPVNHMFKREEIRYILEDSGSRCLLTTPAYQGACENLCVMIEQLAHVVCIPHLLQQEDAPLGPPAGLQPGPQDTAVFLYTSGTTGRPKAAMLRHCNLLANVASSARAVRVTPRDTVICFLPLFHSFAATVCMLMPLACGAKTVIMKSPRPIRRLLRALRRNNVTILVGIPSLYSILKDIHFSPAGARRLLRLILPGRLLTGRLRLAISGAAALPVDVFKKFEARFGIPLLEGYGLTEASPVVSLNPLKGPRRPGSIGLPLPDVKTRIVDENGRECPTGVVGELTVKGPNVMSGYYRRPDDNQEVLREGWLSTGDMARVDADGYLYIMGRKKEMVNVRGLNVYPREIEEVLYRHPAVREAAVIGIPDPHKGEVPKGFVVLKTPGAATEHDIIAYLKEHLADYKVPRRVALRENLPKNAAGKILKRLLEEEEMRPAAGQKKDR